MATRAEDSGLPDVPHLSQSGALGPGVAEATVGQVLSGHWEVTDLHPTVS